MAELSEDEDEAQGVRASAPAPVPRAPVVPQAPTWLSPVNMRKMSDWFSSSSPPARVQPVPSGDGEGSLECAEVLEPAAFRPPGGRVEAAWARRAAQQRDASTVDPSGQPGGAELRSDPAPAAGTPAGIPVASGSEAGRGLLLSPVASGTDAPAAPGGLLPGVSSTSAAAAAAAATSRRGGEVAAPGSMGGVQTPPRVPSLSGAAEGVGPSGMPLGGGQGHGQAGVMSALFRQAPVVYVNGWGLVPRVDPGEMQSLAAARASGVDVASPPLPAYARVVPHMSPLPAQPATGVLIFLHQTQRC